jgi:hypothetical protein
MEAPFSRTIPADHLHSSRALCLDIASRLFIHNMVVLDIPTHRRTKVDIFRYVAVDGHRKSCIRSLQVKRGKGSTPVASPICSASFSSSSPISRPSLSHIVPPSSAGLPGDAIWATVEGKRSNSNADWKSAETKRGSSDDGWSPVKREDADSTVYDTRKLHLLGSD